MPTYITHTHIDYMYDIVNLEICCALSIKEIFSLIWYKFAAFSLDDLSNFESILLKLFSIKLNIDFSRVSCFSTRILILVELLEFEKKD